MLNRLLPPPGTARIITLATLVNTFGNGAYLSCSVLFLTRSVGLTPVQLGVGLSIAAVLGTVLSAPLGYVADRVGPKGTQIGALLACALVYAGMVLVTGFWSFVVLACLIAVGEATVKGAAGAMIAGAVPPDQRLELRAFVRSVNNGGIALGTLVGGIPLLLDIRAAYVAMLLGNACTFVLAAAILSRAARVPVLPVPADGPRMVALRDRPFLVFTAIDGFMASAYNEIISLGLPLWLATQRHAPLWLVTVALLVNTVGCVTLQVWASRGVDGIRDAARIGRRGAMVVGVACVLYGLTAGLPVWAVAVLVVVASGVHVLGELWLSTATFSVVFGLAPDWAQGQYQGTYAMGRQFGNMVTPPLLAVLVASGGRFGWVGMGALFGAAGVVYPAVVRWGVRTRPLAAVGV
ncbi:MFS transporter [Longispora urticae]